MKPVANDQALWEALRLLAKSIRPDLREGSMFGSLAVYVGPRMACCVLGREVGLRVPASTAEDARAAGRASAFTPYGRAPMRERKFELIDVVGTIGLLKA